MAKVAIVVTYRIRPGKEEELLALLKAHVARTRETEPGCIQFDILRPWDESGVIRLHEVYADDAAFRTHTASDQLARYKAASEPLLAERSVTWCTVEER